MKTIKVQEKPPEPKKARNFTGYLRCDTGVRDLDKPRIILIKPGELDSKKLKYPKLIVQETVNE